MGLVGLLLFGIGALVGGVLVWRFSRLPQKVSVNTSEEFMLRDAEKILKESQYKILERNHSEMVAVQIWGKRMSEPIVVDLMVEKDGKRYAVVVDRGEMSTGGLIQPEVRHRILEAYVAFPKQPVLFVRTQTGEMTEVAYQSIHYEKIRPVALIFGLAGVLGALFLFLFFFLR